MRTILFARFWTCCSTETFPRGRSWNNDAPGNYLNNGFRAVLVSSVETLLLPLYVSTTRRNAACDRMSWENANYWGEPAMQIPVLIEPLAKNGYRACGMEPFAVSAKGATREEALAKLRAKIEGRLKKGAQLVGLEIGASSDPWIEFAGMFKDDPWIEDWKRSIEEYRKQVDENPDTL
jgi:predicted RNase H-like HicB family nuclease